MKIFNRFRQPIDMKFAQFPAGEWRLESVVDRPLVIEATGMEPDFWPKAGILSAAACMAGQSIKLAMPYLPAARDDHDPGFGAHVYASLIDALGVNELHVFDPHSKIMVGTLNTPVVVHHATEATVLAVKGQTVAGIIAPDKGAVERALSVAQALGLPLVTATKVRDPATGRLSNFEAPTLPEREGFWLVVDDICDGGGTFIGLAKALRLPPKRLRLWVSHAVFSGRARDLVEYYGWIYTTNSFVPHNTLPCTVIPVHQFMKGLYDHV